MDILILFGALGILGGGPFVFGEEEEMGTMLLLTVEEGAEVIGGVALDRGGVADVEVGVLLADVEILLLLLLFGLPPLDLGKGVVGRETPLPPPPPPPGGPPIPLDIM